MATSNARRRQVARAKFERQQARRLTRARHRRVRNRIALVATIVILVGLISVGLYWIFFRDSTTPATAAGHVTFTGRASTHRL